MKFYLAIINDWQKKISSGVYPYMEAMSSFLTSLLLKTKMFHQMGF